MSAQIVVEPSPDDAETVAWEELFRSSNGSGDGHSPELTAGEGGCWRPESTVMPSHAAASVSSVSAGGGSARGLGLQRAR